MKHRVRLGLLSSVSLAALVAGGTVAWADTKCNGSLTGTIVGNVVVPTGGSCTLYQANVTGNIQVSQTEPSRKVEAQLLAVMLPAICDHSS
jgi:hypothetical protein